VSAPQADRPDDRRAWELPGPQPVAPGVHRIPLPLPGDALRAVNVYAVADGQGLTLVDAGWALADSRRELERALGVLGHDLREIHRFLVTHVHRDHYTQAIVIRRLLGTRVELGQGEHHSLEEILANPQPLGRGARARLSAAGAGALLEALLTLIPDGAADVSDWGLPDGWLVDGQKIALADRTLEVLETPGHTRGHVVFHDAAAGLLFAGDHVLPNITPSIGFEGMPSSSPLRDYLTSLARLDVLGDPVLLPAHGPVLAGTRERVRELQAHHEHRLEASLAAVRNGASTGYEVAGALTWTRRNHRFADLDPFNQMLAVIETAAHLLLLVDRGALSVTDIDGVTHYTDT
jgi:glyoxylase-like metal-dependent hydrolase (beta-lactamase superfamily II)